MALTLPPRGCPIIMPSLVGNNSSPRWLFRLQIALGPVWTWGVVQFIVPWSFLTLTYRVSCYTWAGWYSAKGQRPQRLFSVWNSASHTQPPQRPWTPFSLLQLSGTSWLIWVSLLGRAHGRGIAFSQRFRKSIGLNQSVYLLSQIRVLPCLLSSMWKLLFHIFYPVSGWLQQEGSLVLVHQV